MRAFPAPESWVNKERYQKELARKGGIDFPRGQNKELGQGIPTPNLRPRTKGRRKKRGGEIGGGGGECTPKRG